MAINTQSLKKDELLLFLRKAFSDYYSLNDLMAPFLSRLIDDFGKLPRHKVTVRFLADNYSSPALNADKQQAEQVKTLLTAAYLLHLQTVPELADLLCDQSALLAAYPSFEGLDHNELGYLLAFRNFLMLALTFVPAKGNKIFLLKVIERLEGSSNEYVTGSGQKPAVTRRVNIYETEGNVKAKRKAEGDGVAAKKAVKAEAAPAPAVQAPLVDLNFVNSAGNLKAFDWLVPVANMGLDKILTNFYTGSLTEEIMVALEDFDDANLAQLA